MVFGLLFAFYSISLAEGWRTYGKGNIEVIDNYKNDTDTYVAILRQNGVEKISVGFGSDLSNLKQIMFQVDKNNIFVFTEFDFNGPIATTSGNKNYTEVPLLVSDMALSEAKTLHITFKFKKKEITKKVSLKGARKAIYSSLY